MPEPRKLEGRSAIVTGAGSGIGRAICLGFVAAGARVVVADIDAAAAEATAAACGPNAVAIACDVSSDAQARATIELAVARFGGLQVLVNNAATFIPDGTVVTIAEADWNRTIAVNLTGPFLMAKHAVPVMAAGGGGSIINLGSQLAQVGKAGRGWYCAAKAAIVQLSTVMAIDHAAENIRVNSLSPGPVATPRTVEKYGGVEVANQTQGAMTLLGRMGQPAEIAAAALFLASDDSSFMTGADLLVDGGYVAR